MKKLTLLLCAFLITGLSAIQAQTGKGTIMVGATSYVLGVPLGTSSGILNAGFGKTTYKSIYGDYESKITNLSLMPKAAYFFADNIAGGLEFVLSSASEQDQEEDGKDIQTLFLVGPFFRYFFPMGNNYAYLELEGGFGSFKDKWTGTNDYVDKYSVTAFGGGAGLIIPAGPKAGFDVSLGYSTYTAKYTESEDEKMTTGSFGIKIGFLLFLGKE